MPGSAPLLRRNPALQTRPISLSTLLKGKRYFRTKIKSWKTTHWTQVYCKDPEHTYEGRYPKHIKFFEAHKHEIRIFADVGCALRWGAPTTVEAKTALGKGTRVYAVDYFGFPERKKVPTLEEACIPSLTTVRKDLKSPDPKKRARAEWDLKIANTTIERAREEATSKRAAAEVESRLQQFRNAGIIPKKHSIVEAPLPFQCDAIRFANVGSHMSESQRRSALVNIWKSLKPGGYLIGATEGGFSGYAPAAEHQFFLRKTPRGFEEIIDVE